MRKTLSFVGLALFAVGQVFGVDPVYRPLWLYEGTWKATKRSPQSEPTTNLIVNECAMTGRFFACQQTVNGKAGALIIFVPATAPGDYYTQAVLQAGLATGRGELHIDGDRWTYSSKTQQDGKTTYRRTTNMFSGKNRIHFEQSESSDGQNWTVTMSGDEVRTSKGKR